MAAAWIFCGPPRGCAAAAAWWE